jgi:glycine hydroxymethyltransferase
MGAKMVPFAGWNMPVWYTSVLEEHQAVRQAAGLFDVTHMGVYQTEGPDAGVFLDSVCGNDISSLEIGESCYTHFLTQMPMSSTTCWSIGEIKKNSWSL